jgi:hypothetical protein
MRKRSITIILLVYFEIICLKKKEYLKNQEKRGTNFKAGSEQETFLIIFMLDSF